jgi:hypothetical protein
MIYWMGSNTPKNSCIHELLYSLRTLWSDKLKTIVIVSILAAIFAVALVANADTAAKENTAPQGKPVNHPRLETGGMSREGFGKLVDKEA